jgi:hypothetical protein
MKKLVLFHFVTFVFIVKAISQNTDEARPKSDNCFLAMEVPLRPNIVPASKTFCLGEKIVIKRKDHKTTRGKISKLSQQSITIGENEIDINSIKWIKKSKLSAGGAIAGGLMTVAGFAIFAHLSKGNTDFDQIPLEGGLGIVLVTGGVLVATSHKKFHIDRGDKLIFK